MALFKHIHLPRLASEAATLLSGNVVAQGISLAAYFLLTRLYSPSDFGLFNVLFSYVELLIIISTCKYEQAVIVVPTDDDARLLARATLRLNAIVSLVILTIIAIPLILNIQIPALKNQLSALSLLVPPLVFFTGTSRVYGALFNRARRYRPMAVSATVNSVSAVLAKVLLALLNFHRSGMPVGTVLGQACGNISYRHALKKLYPDISCLPRISKAETAGQLKKYKSFPLFIASKEFIGSLSAVLPVLWASFYFDDSAIGLFSLALTFTHRPVNILCSAFEKVLYARTADQLRNHLPATAAILKFLLILNAVAIPLFAAAWFLATPVFGVLFGARWAACGPFVQALIPMVFVSLSASSLAFIPNIYGTQRYELFIGLTMLLLRIVALAVGFARADYLLAIQLYALASAFVSAAQLSWYLIQLRFRKPVIE